MTTNVTINAHCDDKKEVKVRLTDTGELSQEYALQNGQSDTRVVYDDIVISIWEQDKSEGG
jgi:hypothetical protein